MREIGTVKHLQVQRSPLKSGENPNRIYNPAPLLKVERLLLFPQGVIGVTDDGGEIVDVHNADHLNSKNSRVNGVSVGFTAHYVAMRGRFGEHLTDAIAGENILVEAGDTIKLADLGKRLAFQNPASGTLVYLDDLMVADPCEPFSRFALCQNPPVPAALMKETLQFLGDGMRGFYATATQGSIQVGDRVFAFDGSSDEQTR